MTRFGDATAVEQVGEGRYKADLHPDFVIGEALNGGYLLAVLARAAVAATPHAHPVSTAANFHRVTRPGPAQVIVEPRKVGRTVASALVTLVQDDRPTLDALITTGTLDTAAELTYVGAPPAALPPLEDCIEFQHGRFAVSFTNQVDMRYDPSTVGWLDGQPSGRLEVRAWVRLRDDHPPDAYALALAVDALLPVTSNIGGTRGWTPTVELTWHLRGVPAPGWLAVHGTGRLLADGWFDEEIEVWDSAGRLVAQSRQLARAPRSRP